MKKIIAILLCAIMCVCFFGCNNSSKAEETTKSTLEQNTTTIANLSETQSQTTENTTESSVTNSEKVTLAQSDTFESTTKSHKNEVSTTKENITVASTTVKPQDTTKPISKNITCTVKIECSKLLENKNRFSDDVSLIPQNGVILETTSVTLSENATAYDAMKLACSKKGVSVNEKSSSFGVYIVGFNGVDEKDCGSMSGWLYTVNGKSPNVSVSKYNLKNGDSIVFSYTC